MESKRIFRKLMTKIIDLIVWLLLICFCIGRNLNKKIAKIKFMKRQNIFAIALCLCFIIQTFSQEKKEITVIEKYKQFGLVWGLIKYHHSEVSKGKYDWDSIFIENIDKLDIVTSQSELNDFLLNFILSIQTSKIKIDIDNEDLFKKNLDYDWIEQYSANDKLYNYLKQLKENTIIGDYYVVKQINRKLTAQKDSGEFKSFDYKIKSHRLLELFSYWNVIQYHYVNKYLIDTNWVSQLDYFVDGFINSNSNLEYEVQKNKLIASIKDCHAYHLSKLVSDSLIFKYKPPFRVKLVNDTLVVTGIFNNKLGEKDDLKLGDLIIEVQDQNIKSVLNKKVGSMLSFSNDSYLKRVAGWVFYNNEDSIKVKIKRKDSIIDKYIHLYKDFEVKDPSWLKSFYVEKKWQLIDNKIGYINLKEITKNELKEAFEEFSNTDGIVIDLRNAPKYISEADIPKYTYPEKRKFIKVLFPLPDRPSLAKFDTPLISYILDPFESGSKNLKYYDKRIVLLVNGSTQSRMEFIGMAIQASPNCLTIGESTAGSVMNIATFTMADGTQTNFTSLGAFYPDGTEVQKKGLKIDYFVNETTSNFTQDQYIKEAIKQIRFKS
ncbi:S41 family peptidase [Flavobacterium sp. DGU38]|uniref:S41 family peptidase n=1 Tax=Flavobacterium calami TaxID=3139144 RepID=A0ABU9III9_9FLAO